MAGSTQLPATQQPAERGRRVEICLEGNGITPGRAPLDILMDVADVAQEALYALGRLEFDPGGSVAGRIPDTVRMACRLELLGVQRGSAVAVLELPAPSTLQQDPVQLSLGLPSGAATEGLATKTTDHRRDAVELGNRALSRYKEFLAAVASQDRGRLGSIVQDTATRSRLLRGLQRIGHWTRSGVVSTVMLGGQPAIRVDNSVARAVDDMVVERRVGDVCRVGKIVLVQVEPSRYFYLAVGGLRTRCNYGAELDPVVIKGIGQVVEVYGQGTFDGKEEPSEIAVDNVEPVNLSPIVLKVVPTQRGTFRLSPPLQFYVSYGDGLLIAENPDFRTLSYGRNRQELRNDILADIEELWRAYVEESPDQLTEGGLALRQRLQDRMLFIPEEQSESEEND